MCRHYMSVDIAMRVLNRLNAMHAMTSEAKYLDVNAENPEATKLNAVLDLRNLVQEKDII